MNLKMKTWFLSMVQILCAPIGRRFTRPSFGKRLTYCPRCVSCVLVTFKLYERAMRSAGLLGGGEGEVAEERPVVGRSRSAGRKRVMSDDEGDDPEYLMPSDDD